MRVAMVDPANLTPFYSYALCDSLASAGTEIKFYSTEYDNDLTLEAPSSFDFVDHYFRKLRTVQRTRHKFIRKLIRGLSYHFNHQSLIKQLQENKTNIVHMQWAILPKLDLLFIKSLKSINIPVVLTVHDVDPLFDAGSHKDINAMYHTVDALIVHNQTASDNLQRIYPEIDTNKIHVIPHGPLQSEDIPPNKCQLDARASLDIPSDADVVTFFGEIKTYKGLDYLIEACVELKKNKPNLFLLIAGKPGSAADSPNLDILDNAGIPYRADLGFVAGEDVWKYYLAADIIALPYRQISQSGVLFSALAHKRYVICSAVGALPEILEELGGGSTFPRGDISALSHSLSLKLSNKEQTQQEADKGYDNLMNLYSWDSIAEKSQYVYKHLTKS